MSTATTATPAPRTASVSPEARRQQAHYDRIAAAYVRSLDEPHTEAYLAHLDRLLLAALPPGALGDVAELCCGRGEGLRLIAAHRGADVASAVGVDISAAMLTAAANDPPGLSGLRFIQADVTSLPLDDASLDTVLVLGGIHHVNDRGGLFSEIARVLRPGGRLVYREPVDDWAPWRWLRAAIYRLSPTLDPETERPLRRRGTEAALRAAGLDPGPWRLCGFAGAALLLNSDVLLVNRALRWLPGVRTLAGLAAGLDDRLLALPGLRGAGLQVVGSARRR